MNTRPTMPLDSYPDAELPPLLPEGASGEDAAPIAQPVRTRPEVAVLRFLDPGAHASRVVLEFPFELDGREVREVVVRRLNVAQVAR